MLGVGHYQQLQTVKQSGRIAPEKSEMAAGFLQTVYGGEPEPTKGIDLSLLRAARDTADPLPLLCLRCRTSHALEAWIKATYRAHGQQYGLDLAAMASYALDDDGKIKIRVGPGRQDTRLFTYQEISDRSPSTISPFSAEVLRSYDPALCGLPHWSRLKIQANGELKRYFREHGLLLISDWALLRNSSQTRVREACSEHLRSSDSISRLCELHARYVPLYDEAKQAHKRKSGKASGWQPDLKFLTELDPGAEAFETKDRLIAVSRAIRSLMTGKAVQSLNQQANAGFEAVDPASLKSESSEDGATPAELKSLINTALIRAMDQLMPQVLANTGKKAELLRCLWTGWSMGLKQRALAERCATSQGTVSKQLRPEQQATAIAIAAAVVLKRHPAFSSCSESVEAAERLVEALRNHLLEPELGEGDISLRSWVQDHLSKA